MNRGLLAIAFVALSCATAWAQKPVAVAKIEGDKDGSVTAAVVAALDKEFKVISPKAVARSAEQMDVAIDDVQAARLIADLEADALVMGTVEKTDEGHKLQLRVFPLGARKSRAAWIIYAGKPKAEKVQTGVRTAVSTILTAALKENADSNPEEEDAERPARGGGKRRVEQESDAESPDGRGKVFRPVTGRPGKSRFAERTGAEDPPDVDKEPPAPPPRRVAMEEEEQPEVDVGLGAEELAERRSRASPARVNAGPSISTRSLRFNSRVFDAAPKPYTADGVVGGVRVQGELYPLGFSGQGALSGLGVGFELDHTFGLKIRTQGMEFGTIVRHYSVDLRYRFGKRRTNPSVTVEAGYGRRTFVVARGSGTLDLPDVDYQMLTPGLAFRLPTGPVAFYGEARALIVRSAGAIEKPTSYGAATITAFDAEGGLEIDVSPRVALRMGGDIAYLAYTFDGTGAMSNNRDQEPATKDVGGAADRYIGASVTLAVSY